MAYQNLTLRNIAGEMSATYNDNNMRSQGEIEPKSGPVSFVTGLAKSGLQYEPYRYENFSSALQEFSSRSELARIVTAVNGANRSTPMVMSRIGAKPYHVMIKRAIPGSYEKETLVSVKPQLIQVPESDRSIRGTLEQLKLVLMPYVEGSLVRQRALIALISNTGISRIIYDSERMFRNDGDLVFDVELELPVGEFLFTPSAFSSSLTSPFINGTYDFDDIKALSEVTPTFADVELMSKTSDILSQNNFVDIFGSNASADISTDTSYSIDFIDASVPDYIDNCERYAGNELAYEKLEFENIDFLYCEKCYADVNPVSINASTPLAEQIEWPKNSLGFYWKFIFNGRPNMFFFVRSNPFDSANVDNYSHSGIDYSLSTEQKAVGDLLNLVEFHLHPSAGATTSVESFWNDRGLVECHINVNAPSAGEAAVEIETPFATLSIAGGALTNGTDFTHRFRPSVLGESRALSDYMIASSSRVSIDPFVIRHFELTGELTPEAVMNRLMSFPESGALTSVSLEASNVEVREVSFLHQAAQAAYRASTNYSQTVALVPVSPPPASHNGISSWAGNPAEYEISANGEIIVTKDGSGVLGTRLLAGAKDYRDGAAFGGVILTNGENLPNKIPYGIDDTDEALDQFGNPIDLGKHAVVIGAWGYITDPASTNSVGTGKKIRTNQRTSAFVNAGPSIASILSGLQPGTEPIGPVRGVVPGFLPQQRTPKAVLDNLAALRVCMIDQTGVISSIYTSALRTSDYSKISSIMSANAILGMVRSICMPVIGSAYKDEEIASLSQRLDGAMRQMAIQGYAQSAPVVRLTASQVDRINGVLRCSVTFIPPLSIEAITIDLTLQAPGAINA